MPLLICSVDEEENIFKINGFIFLQAICSGTILLFTYIALLYMPFGDAMTIVFTSPIFAMILSKIFLNEPCSMYKTFSLISLTLGVMLVLQPPFIFGQSNRTTDIEIAKTKRGKEYYYGASLAFGSAIASALHCVSVGRLFRNSTSNSALLLAFYGGVGGLFVILPAAYVDKSQSVFSTNIVNIMPRTWGLLLSVSMLGLIGFVAVNLSLKKIKPVYASFVGVSEIALAYICQVTIFHTVPSLCGIIGSIMVVITVCTLPFEAIISERFRKLVQKI
jgi:drug/metabolite transporter (DMT)-like permease